jgi:hypothetical protein
LFHHKLKKHIKNNVHIFQYEGNAQKEKTTAAFDQAAYEEPTASFMTQFTFLLTEVGGANTTLMIP